MKISVLESGSWGTALAAALAKNGHEVTLHSLHTYRSELLRSTRENPRLPGVSLPENLLFEDGLAGVACESIRHFDYADLFALLCKVFGCFASD